MLQEDKHNRITQCDIIIIIPIRRRTATKKTGAPLVAGRKGARAFWLVEILKPLVDSYLGTIVAPSRLKRCYAMIKHRNKEKFPLR